MAKYVIGVDGGGTKTHCVLFDTEGNRIDMASWGPTNYERLKGGLQELKEELGKLFSYVLDKNNVDISEIGKCAFGMAGVDTKTQHDKISSIIRGLGITDFVLCNDAFLGIKAGCPEGYGICVNNGTGYTVVGINQYGRMFQVGGLGYLSGDRGGGGYLGIMAVSSVYNYLFRGGEYTCMKEILFEELKINSRYDYTDIITEGLGSGKINIRDLCRVVFAAANMNDKLSLQILEEMGNEYAISVNSIINEIGFKGVSSLDIVLAGSVNVKGENPVAINKLKTEVLNRNPDMKINFKILKAPPVTGAVIWSLEGMGDRHAIYSKVVEQL